MNTNQKIEKLIEENILTSSIHEPAYSYKGTPILRKYSPYNYKLITSELGAFYKDMLPPYRMDLSAVIDEIYYTAFPPSLFYKKGTLRKGFINTVIGNCASGILKKHFSTQKMVEKLSANWDKLDEETKKTLCNQSILNAEGIVIKYFSSISIVNKEGNREIIYDNESDYVPTENIYDVYVSKEAPKNVEVHFASGTTVLVTENEYNYTMKHYTICSSCGKLEGNEYLVFGWCRSCTKGMNLELKGYQEKAPSSLSFQVGTGKKYHKRFLGVELEYERKTGSQREALFLLNKHLKDHAIFKRDGSLTDGIEICTRPASIDVHLEYLKKMYDDEILMERIEVKDTCGMHVHIDRRKLSALTIGKLIKFMGSSSNKSFLEIISGRNETPFAKLGYNPRISEHIRGDSGGERYLALNMRNTNTAEIRIFKTPSSHNEFTKNMEFVTAIADFILPANSGVKELEYGNLISFVNSNKSSYPTLHKFCKEKF